MYYVHAMNSKQETQFGTQRNATLISVLKWKLGCGGPVDSGLGPRLWLLVPALLLYR